MSLSVFVWLLTGLCAAAVLATRFSLLRNDATRPVAATLPARAHLVVGLVSAAVWSVFLVFSGDAALGSAFAGVVALGGWWITAALGVKLFSRWLPSAGRHSGLAPQKLDPVGFALSALVHGTVLVSVLVFTWAYVTASV